VGLIHFVGMSTEHDYTIGSAQYLWIEQDLMNLDRTKTPWVIFGGHRAMYINSNYGGSVTSDITVMNALIENIEPLLWKYRVNLAFWGHNHVVQRHAAVLNKTVIQHSVLIESSVYGEVPTAMHDDPQATVHMVVGTGGAQFTENYVSPYPDWNEKVFYKYGYARVVTHNASYLEWEWVSSIDHLVYDIMVITQGDPTKPWVLVDESDDTQTESNGSTSSHLGHVEKGFLIFGCVVIGLLLIALLVVGFRKAYARYYDSSEILLSPRNSSHV
jgi:hypothetical protein